MREYIKRKRKLEKLMGVENKYCIFSLPVASRIFNTIIVSINTMIHAGQCLRSYCLEKKINRNIRHWSTLINEPACAQNPYPGDVYLTYENSPLLFHQCPWLRSCLTSEAPPSVVFSEADILRVHELTCALNLGHRAKVLEKALLHGTWNGVSHAHSCGVCLIPVCNKSLTLHDSGLLESLLSLGIHRHELAKFCLL